MLNPFRNEKGSELQIVNFRLKAELLAHGFHAPLHEGSIVHPDVGELVGAVYFLES